MSSATAEQRLEEVAAEYRYGLAQTIETWLLDEVQPTLYAAAKLCTELEKHATTEEQRKLVDGVSNRVNGTLDAFGGWGDSGGEAIGRMVMAFANHTVRDGEEA